MEKILWIGIPNVEEAEQVAKKLRLRTVLVTPEQYRESIGSLAGYTTSSASSDMPEIEAMPPEGLLVMCGLKNSLLDRFLHTLRSAGLVFPYKAVLTQTNSQWNALQLAYGLEHERNVMEVQDNKSSKTAG